MERKPLLGMNYDYFILAAVLGICMILVFSIPANYFPFRKQVFLSCFRGKTEFTTKENLLITSLFMTLSCAVAILFPSILSVLSIIGGLCSVTMCFLIPMIALVRTSEEKWYHWYNLLAILCFSILVGIGYTSVVITIYQISEGKAWLGYRPDLAF